MLNVTNMCPNVYDRRHNSLNSYDRFFDIRHTMKKDETKSVKGCTSILID